MIPPNNKINNLLKNNYDGVPDFLRNLPKNQEFYEMQKKLKVSEEWNNKLMDECTELKSQLLQTQTTNNAVFKVRS